MNEAASTIAARSAMVERQLRARGIADERVLEAMAEVPRHLFVPAGEQDRAYADCALRIGEGQTISQPYIVAHMIEAAQVSAQDRVLEIGAGSGYAAAVLGRVAARVFSIERHEALAYAARQRLEQLGCDNVSIIAGDGLEGLPEEAPFDAILVPARADEVPEALKAQLAVGGRLIIPVGGNLSQQLLRITRTSEDEWTRDTLGGVRFVPLVPGTAPK